MLMMKDGTMSVTKTEEFNPIREASPNEAQEDGSSSFENMQTELHSKGVVLTKAWSDLFSFITKYQAELVVKENSVGIAEKEIEERKKQFEEVASAGAFNDETIQDMIRTKERLLNKAQSELGVKDRMLQSLQSDLSSHMELLEKSQCDLLKKQSDLVRYRGDVEQLKSELNVKQEQIKIKDSLLKKLQNQLMKENVELKEQLELAQRALELEKEMHELTKRTMSSSGPSTRKRARMSEGTAATVEIPDSPPTLDLSDDQNLGLSKSQTQSSEQGRRVSSRLRSATGASQSSTDHSSRLRHTPTASASSQVTLTLPKDAQLPATFLASSNNNVPVGDATAITDSDTYFPLSVSEDTKPIDILSEKVDSVIEEGDLPPETPSSGTSDNEDAMMASELIYSPESSTDAKNRKPEVWHRSNISSPKTSSHRPKYTCQLCEKSFPSKQSLECHILVHSDEACEFKCSQCEKAYITKWSLRQHMLVHTGEKPYKCEDCDYFSRQVAPLRVHMINEHGKMLELSAAPFTKVAPIASAVIAATISRSSSRLLESNLNDSSETFEKSNLVNDSQELTCDLCYLMFSSYQSLMEHRHTHTTEMSGSLNWTSEFEVIASTDAVMEEDVSNLESHSQGIYCSLCDLVLPSAQLFRVHQRTHTDGHSNLKSNEANIVTSSEAVGQEESNFDSRSQQIYCNLCNLVFLSERSLRLHRRTHTDSTDNRSHKCSVCDETFERAGDLKKHDCVHEVQKSFVCPVCQKTCQSKIDLQNHILLHEDNSKKVPKSQDGREKLKSKMEQCPVCQKWFAGKSYLKVHLTSHTDERPWNCSTCGKAFRQKAGRDKHELIHKGIKPFKCPVCQKDFRAKSDVNHHMQVHNKKRGEPEPKNEQCPFCEKCFATKGRVRSHLRSHTDDKPWECSICGKFFRAKAGRDNHQMIHTGEKPHKCDLCGKTFRSKYNLRFHMMYHAKMAAKKPEAYLRPRVEPVQETAHNSQAISASVAGYTDVANSQILTNTLGTPAIAADVADPNMFLIKTEDGKQWL